MDDRLLTLLDAYLEHRLTAGEADELRHRLRSSPEARHVFWEYVEQHALIEDLLAEARGRDLALAEGTNSAADLVSVTRPNQPTPPATGLWPIRVWVGMAATLAALLLIVSWWWHPAHNPVDSSEAVQLATVRSLAGEVAVIDRSGKTFKVTSSVPLAPGQMLQVGDEESRAEVVFADGTQITLGSGTNVRFPAQEASKEHRLHLDRGAVQVQTANNAVSSPFIVTTDHARITGSATRFRLYRELKASRLELEAGKVRLEDQLGERVVEVGQGSFVTAGDGPEPMAPQPLPLGHCQLRHTFLRAGDVACFSRDGATLVTSHFARGWKAWRTSDGALTAAAPSSRQRCHGLAFTTLADTALALGHAGTALFWKLGDPGTTRTGLREKDLRCGAVSADGRWLAQGTSKGEVTVWEVDPDNGRISLLRSLALKPSRVALSCVGPHLAVSRWAGEIHVLDARTGREVAQHRLQRTPTPLALSAQNRFLAAYANEAGLVLFDHQAGTHSTLWPGEGARVSCLNFSGDGRVLFAGLEDGTLRGWSTETGTALLVLDSGHRTVSRLALTADLSLLATVGDGDCVKIWECRLP